MQRSHGQDLIVTDNIEVHQIVLDTADFVSSMMASDLNILDIILNGDDKISKLLSPTINMLHVYERTMRYQIQGEQHFLDKARKNVEQGDPRGKLPERDTVPEMQRSPGQELKVTVNAELVNKCYHSLTFVLTEHFMVMDIFFGNNDLYKKTKSSVFDMLHMQQHFLDKTVRDMQDNLHVIETVIPEIETVLDVTGIQEWDQAFVLVLLMLCRCKISVFVFVLLLGLLI